jgi:hypothetical protein
MSARVPVQTGRACLRPAMTLHSSARQSGIITGLQFELNNITIRQPDSEEFVRRSEGAGGVSIQERGRGRGDARITQPASG